MSDDKNPADGIQTQPAPDAGTNGDPSPQPNPDTQSEAAPAAGEQSESAGSEAPPGADVQPEAKNDPVPEIVVPHNPYEIGQSVTYGNRTVLVEGVRSHITDGFFVMIQGDWVGCDEIAAVDAPANQ
jgi:hypothetical protein